MKNPNNFNKTKEYEQELIDLIFKLKSICNSNKIPMFLSLCLKNDENSTDYKTEMISAVSSGIQLTDDKFVSFVKILNGFDAVPKAIDDEFEFD